MPLDRLLLDLQSADPAARRSAIDRLERVGSEEAAGALVLLLADPDAAVRQRAADVLAGLGQAAVEPVVRYLANWNGQIDTVITQLLGKLYAVPALDLLLAHIADRDPSTRAAIADALGRIGSRLAMKDTEDRLHHDLIPALLELLRDFNADVKLAAARSLGILASPEAVDALLDELPDDNPAVRIAAADALGRIGDRRAVDSLSRLAGEDPHPAVRRTAEAALRRISRHAVDPLIRALAGDSLEERLQAVAALLEEGRTAVMPLTSLLTHQDSAVRASAVDVLGRIGDPACLDALLPLIHDHDSSVRLAAAKALGRIPHPRCAERLARALQDSDPLVAAAAADSLVGLGEIALAPVFQILNSRFSMPDTRLAASPDTSVRAIAVLGRLRHRGACTLLINGLQDEATWVRIVSARALGEIGETSAIPALINALSDRNTVVRAMAAEALGRMGDYRATMPLLNLLADPSDLVRINSLRSLGEINNPMAIPFVIRSLDAAEPEVRAAAITALAMMGAREVLPRLRQIARIWPLSREPRIVKQAARCAIAVLSAVPIPEESDETQNPGRG